MSIFKESFRKYVRQQIELRQKIVSLGEKSPGRFSEKKVKLESDNKEVILPEGAFYNYTTSKTCAIRMSSGVDLTNVNGLDIEDRFKGSELAKNWILEGGTLFRGKKSPDEEFFVQRRGFPGGKNKIATTYGDPTIKSDAQNNYGIVPMPGIISANIRTKSAYGSLREAKIDWVCHNQRQLEVLELLYMRPGHPILLEWGWSPYITNDGQLENSFPHVKEFWSPIYTQEDICKKIISNKISTSGNYDGLFGLIKNFSFQARDDGGFNCTTELISSGELIESIKGKKAKLFIEKTNDDEDEDEENGKSSSKPQTHLGILLGALKEFTITLDNQTQDLSSLEGWGDAIEDLWNIVVDGVIDPAVEYIKGTETKVYNLPREGKEPSAFHIDYWKEVKDEDNNRIKNRIHKELCERLLIPFEGNLESGIIPKSPIVNNLIFYPGSIEQNTNFKFKGSYIKWDAFAQLLNSFVLPTVPTNQTTKSQNNTLNQPNIISIQTRTLLREDENIVIKDNETSRSGAHLSPLLYHNFHPPFLNPERNLNISIDPSVCLLPSQINEYVQTNRSIFRYLNPLYLAGYAFISPSIVAGTSLYDYMVGSASFKLNDKEADRYIGNIYLNLDRLLGIYNSMINKESGSDEFSVGKFLKAVWEEVNKACADNHKFILHTDHERPHIIRVVDLNFSAEQGFVPFQLNIDGTQSIARRFNYSSAISNDILNTVSIAAQNPDDIDEIDALTFKAFNGNIKSRFFESISRGFANVQFSADEKEKLSEIYENKLERFTDLLNKINKYKFEILSGEYQENNEKGIASIDSSIVNRMRGALREIQTLGAWLESRYNQDEGRFVKGQQKPPKEQSIPSIIPLNFSVDLDGISGIIIGNVFKIDPERLPESYREEEVCFIVKSEEQNITAGGDWQTKITGQMALLNFEKEPQSDASTSTDKSKTLDNIDKSVLSEIYTEDELNEIYLDIQEKLDNPLDDGGLAVEEEDLIDIIEGLKIKTFEQFVAFINGYDIYDFKNQTNNPTNPRASFWDTVNRNYTEGFVFDEELDFYKAMKKLGILENFLNAPNDSFEYPLGFGPFRNRLKNRFNSETDKEKLDALSLTSKDISGFKG